MQCKNLICPKSNRYGSEELAELQSHKKNETKHRFGCQTVEDYQLTIEQLIEDKQMMQDKIRLLEQRQLTPEKCDRVLNYIGLSRADIHYLMLERELIEAFGGDWRNRM